MCRDILSAMGSAFGFVTSKEVVVAPWFKKPDVELFDASGELLTIYLDVTLPSLHQEAVTSREQVYERRGRLKQKRIHGKIHPVVCSTRVFVFLLFLLAWGGGSVTKETISFVCAKCATKVPLFIF